MVNVNTQVSSSVEFPFGEFSFVVKSVGRRPFPAAEGSDSGWKRHWCLPFSHDLNPGGVSEIWRLLKRLLAPRPRGGEEALQRTVRMRMSSAASALSLT